MDRIELYAEATPAQQEQYVALYIATWQDEPYRERFTREEVLANAQINKEFLYLLVDEAGLVAGFVGGRPLSQCEAFFVNACVPPVDLANGFYIDELGVDRSHRTAGVGRRLTEHLIEVARSRQFHQFVLRTHQSANNPAKRLYERLGFECRPTADGTIHGIDTEQTRIDTTTARIDFRIYYYKIYDSTPDRSCSEHLPRLPARLWTAAFRRKRLLCASIPPREELLLCSFRYIPPLPARWRHPDRRRSARSPVASAGGDRSRDHVVCDHRRGESASLVRLSTVPKSDLSHFPEINHAIITVDSYGR